MSRNTLGFAGGSQFTVSLQHPKTPAGSSVVAVPASRSQLYTPVNRERETRFLAANPHREDHNPLRNLIWSDPDTVRGAPRNAL